LKEKSFMGAPRDLLVCGASLVFVLAVFGCCKKNDDIAVYRIEKPTATSSGAMSMASEQHDSMEPMPGDMGGSMLQDTPDEQSSKYGWVVPSIWNVMPASGMRLASFSFEASDKSLVDVSVVVLSGDAGGLTSNINRWRGQIGLDALSDADVNGVITPLETPVGSVQMCVFSNTATKQGVVAGILTDDQESWFFKASGSDSAASECRASFIEFLESLRKNP
jgi:hypothetical protein